MKIIIDEREHELYNKCVSMLDENTHKLQGIVLLKKVLPLGDILIQTDDDKNNKDVLLIERKTFSDMLASVRDGRYNEQSYRLTHSSGLPLHNVIYLLEGMFSQTKEKDRKMIMSIMTSLHFFKGFSVMRTANVRETAEWLLCTTDKIHREFAKGKILTFSSVNNFIAMSNSVVNQMIEDSIPTNENENTENMHENEETKENINDAETQTPISHFSTEEQRDVLNEPAAYCSVVKKVKKDNINPENIGEILLCQIPLVHSVSAVAIMKKFSSFHQLTMELKTHPDCLNDIFTETNGKKRKLSKAVIENIKHFLLYDKNSS